MTLKNAPPTSFAAVLKNKRGRGVIMVGDGVGFSVGRDDGLGVGLLVGSTDGLGVGFLVGALEGMPEG